MMQLLCLHCSAGGATQRRISMFGACTAHDRLSPAGVAFRSSMLKPNRAPRPRGGDPEVASGHTAACAPPPYLTSLNLTLKEGILRTGTGVKAWR